MGKRGAVMQPTEVAVKKGYYRPSRHGSLNDKIPMGFLCEVPEPPFGLGEVGQKFWNDFLKELVNIKGLIAIVDLPNFEMMAYQYEIINICRIELASGLWDNDKQGNKRQKPEWQTLKDAQRIYLGLSREFGCTPSARNNLKTTNNEEKADPLSSFSL